jgi:hypothetical protein
MAWAIFQILPGRNHVRNLLEPVVQRLPGKRAWNPIWLGPSSKFSQAGTTSGTCSSQLFNGSQAKEHGTQYGLGHLPNSPRQEPRPEPARASCSTFPPTVQRRNRPRNNHNPAQKLMKPLLEPRPKNTEPKMAWASFQNPALMRTPSGAPAKEHRTQDGLGQLPKSPRQEPRPEPARASCSPLPPTVQRQNQTTTQPRPSAEVDDSGRARSPRWLGPASKFAQAVRRPPMPCMGRLWLLGNTARIFILFWCTHPAAQQSNGRKIAHYNL